MDKKFVIILKPSGNRDLSFDHYVVHLQVSPPGQDRENWVEQDINYLPEYCCYYPGRGLRTPYTTVFCRNTCNRITILYLRDRIRRP